MLESSSVLEMELTLLYLLPTKFYHILQKFEHSNGIIFLDIVDFMCLFSPLISLFVFFSAKMSIISISVDVKGIIDMKH